MEGGEHGRGQTCVPVLVWRQNLVPTLFRAQHRMLHSMYMPPGLQHPTARETGYSLPREESNGELRTGLKMPMDSQRLSQGPARRRCRAQQAPFDVPIASRSIASHDASRESLSSQNQALFPARPGGRLCPDARFTEGQMETHSGGEASKGHTLAHGLHRRWWVSRR